MKHFIGLLVLSLGLVCSCQNTQTNDPFKNAKQITNPKLLGFDNDSIRLKYNIPLYSRESLVWLYDSITNTTITRLSPKKNRSFIMVDHGLDHKIVRDTYIMKNGDSLKIQWSLKENDSLLSKVGAVIIGKDPHFRLIRKDEIMFLGKELKLFNMNDSIFYGMEVPKKIISKDSVQKLRREFWVPGG